MTIGTKIKSHPKSVVGFESNLESIRRYESLDSKKYQSDNPAKRLHKNNQQKCLDCLKSRSNKNERECKTCGCDRFYVSNS